MTSNMIAGTSVDITFLSFFLNTYVEKLSIFV